ncbi:MAG: putative AlkP superfamily pyrophosphatase or phosphodiesterase [Cyclobacteriaceae bacterium]|jgi:predicted AlkP superfamily pyrophosphatase or phosphodiesterase
MKTIKWVLGILGAVTFLIIALCFTILQSAKQKEYVNTLPATTGKTVTYLLIDGLSKTIFEKQLAEGNLPNINRLIESGTYVQNGISSFPSMTGYGFYPFLTGIDATKSGVLGLRWFDRTRTEGNLRNYVGRSNIHMNLDVTQEYQGVFEYFDEFYTSSINSYMNKGVHQSQKTGWEMTSAKYYYKPLFKFFRAIPYFGKRITYSYFDHETYVAGLVMDQLEHNPKVQWVTFASPDASHHVSGTTEEYPKLLQHIDGLVGDIRYKIKELGQEDERMIVLISDHGNSEVQKNLDLRVNFQEDLSLQLERGESTVLTTSELDSPFEEFAGKDGYFVINGNLSAYLYMKDPNEKVSENAWGNRLSYNQITHYTNGEKQIDLPKYISNIEGIELVSYIFNDSTIIVQNKFGKGTISTNAQGKYKYFVTDNDPLEYQNDSIASRLMDDQFHSANMWLEASFKTNYPDALHRLFSLVSKPDMGDILICTLENYDLAKDYEMLIGNYRGGHGGIRAEMLNVPYVLYTPGQNSQDIPFARSEDVGATILEYLDMDTEYELDGKSLLHSAVNSQN